MKVLTVFGTRPEAIKMAPIIKVLNSQPKEIQSYICVTGQHRSMLDQALEVFNITPHIDLNVMQQDQELTQLTATLLIKVKEVLQQLNPTCVIVQGDTTTCLAASLAAFYQKIPVAHVEAGLRSKNKFLPYTEEINRVLTSRIAEIHFAPTNHARDNLLTEGIFEQDIHVTGNTIVDALMLIKGSFSHKRLSLLDCSSHLKAIILRKQPFVLITGHRRENFDQGLKNLCEAIAYLAQQHSNWHFIYPVHLNPQVQRTVYTHLGNLNNVHLVEPLLYHEFIHLMDQAKFIISDSGGIQEEAPTLGKPVLLTRTVTERPEGITSGIVTLVGTDVKKIITEAESLMYDEIKYVKMAQVSNLYGDGNAAFRIVDILLKRYFY